MMTRVMMGRNNLLEASSSNSPLTLKLTESLRSPPLLTWMLVIVDNRCGAGIGTAGPIINVVDSMHLAIPGIPSGNVMQPATDLLSSSDE
jgi:hypothetical protein